MPVKTDMLQSFGELVWASIPFRWYQIPSGYITRFCLEITRLLPLHGNGNGKGLPPYLPPPYLHSLQRGQNPPFINTPLPLLVTHPFLEFFNTPNFTASQPFSNCIQILQFV